MSKKKRIYTDDELDELEQLRRRTEWLEAGRSRNDEECCVAVAGW